MSLRLSFVALVAVWLAVPVAAQIPAYEGPEADAVPHYADGPDRRLPEGPGPLTPAAAALTEHGIALWDVDYRRLGHDGGGWPDPLLDVGAAIDHPRRIAEDHAIDLDRVALVGAHLSVWAAGRQDLPSSSGLRGQDPLPVRAAVAVDGPMDLASRSEAGMGAQACGEPVIDRLMGGGPAAVPDR